MDELRELNPVGMLRRTGASPLTPLLFFCGFAALVAAPTLAFSQNSELQAAVFWLFTATLGFSGLVYFCCLFWRRDLLRSETYDLEVRSMEARKQSRLPGLAKGGRPGVPEESGSAPDNGVEGKNSP